MADSPAPQRGIAHVSAKAFLALHGAGRIVDVRSPSEFAQGHIPGAINVPLLDDAGRAEVGTIYAQQGQPAAIARGLELVGPRLSAIRRDCRKAAHQGALRLHCWRGGLRSESVAWLLTREGGMVYLLKGGYKAYRQEVLTAPIAKHQIVVIAGMTGCGKTEILRHLAQLGEAVIDLEGMAHHKGSAFGGLGETAQPSTEMFENRLHAAMAQHAPRKRLWLEDESRNIGRIVLPSALYEAMATAPRVVLEMPPERRTARLVEEYTLFPPGEISACIERIERRLGGDTALRCIQLVQQGAMREAVRGVLAYYDRQYQHQLSTKNCPMAIVQGGTLPMEQIAQAVKLAADSRHWGE